MIVSCGSWRDGRKDSRREGQARGGEIGAPRHKALVKRPLAVYIEKVYDEGNFADLAIGTT